MRWDGNRSPLKFSKIPGLRWRKEWEWQNGDGKMGRHKKLIARFKSRPKDFTWQDMLRLLEGLGYRAEPTGKTSGSRRLLAHPSASSIVLHRPHPGNIVKEYVIKDKLQALTNDGLI